MSDRRPHRGCNPKAGDKSTSQEQDRDKDRETSSWTARDERRAATTVEFVPPKKKISTSHRDEADEISVPPAPIEDARFLRSEGRAPEGGGEGE